jgi:hypothetical protein
MKDWEILADNLSKSGWSWGALQPWILAGERSLLQTRVNHERHQGAVFNDVRLTT